jgi:hypothetical protein
MEMHRCTDGQNPMVRALTGHFLAGNRRDED